MSFDSHIIQQLKITGDEVDFILSEGIYDQDIPRMATVTVTEEEGGTEGGDEQYTAHGLGGHRDNIEAGLGTRPRLLTPHRFDHPNDWNTFRPPSTINAHRPINNIPSVNPATLEPRTSSMVDLTDLRSWGEGSFSTHRSHGLGEPSMITPVDNWDRINQPSDRVYRGNSGIVVDNVYSTGETFNVTPNRHTEVPIRDLRSVYSDPGPNSLLYPEDFTSDSRAARDRIRGWGLGIGDIQPNQVVGGSVSNEGDNTFFDDGQGMDHSQHDPDHTHTTQSEDPMGPGIHPGMDRSRGDNSSPRGSQGHPRNQGGQGHNGSPRGSYGHPEGQGHQGNNPGSQRPAGGRGHGQPGVPGPRRGARG